MSQYKAAEQDSQTKDDEYYNDPIYDAFTADTVYAPTTGEYGARARDNLAGYEAQRQNEQGEAAQQRYGDQARYARNLAGQASAEAGRQASRFGKRANPVTDFGQANQAGAGNERTLAALDTFAANQDGPSGAQAQLQQATQQGLSQQLAMARSGRGFGGNSAAMGQAQGAMAGVTANAANQSAQLKAQEFADARGRQLQALNASMGGGLGLQGQYGGQAQFDTTAALQGRGQNDAAQLANNQLGLAYDKFGADAALGYGQLGENTNLEHQQLGQHALDQQAEYELAQQQMQLEAAKANQSADTERDSGNLGLASSLLGAMFSDERSKTKISRLEGANEALSSALGSDSSGPAALETVRGAPAYSYRYKDPSAPGAKPGRMVGPMAQDLERGPLGDSLVMDTPQGKMVDSGRMTMVTASAVAEQQKQLDALRRALGKAA
jgi:hypothetical protein